MTAMTLSDKLRMMREAEACSRENIAAWIGQEGGANEDPVREGAVLPPQAPGHVRHPV